MRRAFFICLFVLQVGVTQRLFAESAKPEASTQETPQSAPKGGLDLDAISSSATETSVSRAAHKNTQLVAIATVLLMLLLVGVAYRNGGRYPSSAPFVRLSSFPHAAKLVVTFLILIFALTHAIAFVTVYLQTNVINRSTFEYFSYMKPARLTALSHAHIMGIGLMDGTIALLFALSRPSSSFSCAVVAAAFFGVFGDIGSWWLIKYYGDAFELFSIVSGTLCTLADLTMGIGICWTLWRKDKPSLAVERSK